MIQNSLEQLKNELKNCTLISGALSFGIIEKIHALITRKLNSSSITQNALEILNLLARDFEGANMIAENENLLKQILSLMTTYDDVCAEILKTLTEAPHGKKICFVIRKVCLINKLFPVGKFLPDFLNESLKCHIHISSREKFFSTLSHFVVLKPNEFASMEIFNSLIKNIQYPAASKCLSLILYCNEGIRLANEMKIENTLIEALFGARDDEVKTYVLMALKSFLTNRNLYCHINEFPWQRVVQETICLANTKINETLQQTCIQTLRIMSDVSIVKSRLCKLHKIELKKIPCLTNESREMKQDLLQWLEYQNYKSADGNKYSKLFI